MRRGGAQRHGRRAPGLAIGVGEARRIADQPAGGGDLAAVERNWGGPVPYMVASARIEKRRPCELVVNAIERLLTALRSQNEKT